MNRWHFKTPFNTFEEVVTHLNWGESIEVMEQVTDKWIKAAEKMGANFSGTVLDIGCGYGRLSKALKDRVDLTLGIDTNPYVRRWYEFYVQQCLWLDNYDGLKIPLGPNSVRTIVSSLVFKHIQTEDLFSLLQEVSRVHQRGGFFIFDVFNGQIQPKSERVYVHPLRDLEAHLQDLSYDVTHESYAPRADGIVYQELFCCQKR